MDAGIAARTGALLVARPDLATLAVTGADRTTWLQGVVTCDVASLAPGEGRWGLVLSRTGKIQSDVLVVAADDATYLGIAAPALATVHAWLSSFLVMEDADLEDVTASWSWFLLHGPLGSSVAGRIAGQGGAVIGAVDPTGLGGAALMVPRGRAPEVETAARREDGVVVASAEDWLRLRVERLVPLFGVDMDERQSPHEVALDRRTVSWDKGCYLGQEAVCMLEMRGKVKRRLAVIQVESGVVPAAGTVVLDAEGSTAGETRSAVSGASGSLALALLAEAATAPGTRLSVAGAPAVVVEPNR